MTKHSPFYYQRHMRAEFKVAKGCSVRYHDGELSLQYHDTVVASYNFGTGQLTLEHGGWRTYYTKDRINRFCEVLELPVSVYQKSKRFIVDWDDGKRRVQSDWGHIDDGDECELAIMPGEVP